MTRHQVIYRMRPVPAWLRLLHRLRNPRGAWTVASAKPWWWQWFAVLVPYPWRAAHHWYATHNHYFWLPCPLCGTPFGGHEWRAVGGKIASVPDPCGDRRSSVGICPRCTKAGRGVDINWGIVDEVGL